MWQHLDQSPLHTVWNYLLNLKLIPMLRWWRYICYDSVDIIRRSGCIKHCTLCIRFQWNVGLFWRICNLIRRTTCMYISIVYDMQHVKHYHYPIQICLWHDTYHVASNSKLHVQNKVNNSNHVEKVISWLTHYNCYAFVWRFGGQYACLITP